MENNLFFLLKILTHTELKLSFTFFHCSHLTSVPVSAYRDVKVSILGFTEKANSLVTLIFVSDAEENPDTDNKNILLPFQSNLSEACFGEKEIKQVDRYFE